MLIKDLSDQQKDMIKQFKCLYNCRICTIAISEKLLYEGQQYSCLMLLLRYNMLCLKQQAIIDIDIQTLEKLCE